MSAVYDTLNQILGAYALLLAVAGFFLNLLMFYVCCRIKDNTTFVFLRFFSITNIFTLTWWNLYHFYYAFFSLDLGTWLWGCKIGSFVQFSSLQISAWFLVLISVDGVLSVYLRHWKAIYFKVNRAYWASGVLISIFLLINVNVLVLFGYEADFNGTIVEFCYMVDDLPGTYWMQTYGKIHLAIYSLIPFAILGTSNMMLIFKIRSRVTRPSVAALEGGTSASGLNRTSRTIRVVMAITILFVIFTLPVTVATFFYDILFTTDYGTFIAILFDEITFTYFSFNFFVTMFTNLLFKKEIYKMMGKNVLQTAENTSRSKGRTPAPVTK